VVVLDNPELLYFWALGDLHYNAVGPWKALHTQRLAPMFRDLRSLWSREGPPAFCVSPGDIVEMSAPENYELAREELEKTPGKGPFLSWGSAIMSYMLKAMRVWSTFLQDYTTSGANLCVISGRKMVYCVSCLMP